jgi:hypothetical protein
MDMIVVGATRWHFDYSVISFSPVGLNNGQVLWQYQYFYHIYNDWYYTDLGYIEFELNNGTKRMFKIVNDSMESLTLRTTGQWPDGPYGPNTNITLHLTRVGP